MTRMTFTADPAMSFWPTPPVVADDLIYRTLVPGFGDGGAAGGVPQVRVLEPSAGEGHLLPAIREHLPAAHITAVEPSAARARRLRDGGLADEVIESTLEDYLLSITWAVLADTFEPFDIVVMNPPFTLPDRPEAWAQHVLAIHNDPYLRGPYGQISALVPRIVTTGKYPRVLLIDLDTTELVTGRSRLAAISAEPQSTCRRDHPALAPRVIVLTENRECLNARISADQCTAGIVNRCSGHPHCGTDLTSGQRASSGNTPMVTVRRPAEAW